MRPRTAGVAQSRGKALADAVDRQPIEQQQQQGDEDQQADDSVAGDVAKSCHLEGSVLVGALHSGHGDRNDHDVEVRLSAASRNVPQ